jgi:hypothetical protein
VRVSSCRRYNPHRNGSYPTFAVLNLPDRQRPESAI